MKLRVPTGNTAAQIPTPKSRLQTKYQNLSCGCPPPPGMLNVLRVMHFANRWVLLSVECDTLLSDEDSRIGTQALARLNQFA